MRYTRRRAVKDAAEQLEQQWGVLYWGANLTPIQTESLHKTDCEVSAPIRGNVEATLAKITSHKVIHEQRARTYSLEFGGGCIISIPPSFPSLEVA
jgi:hypothetical protein